MTGNERVHKHREKLRGQHCRRLEVWLALDLIQATHRIATYQQQPLWVVVQDALKSHVGLHDVVNPRANRLGLEQRVERYR